MALGLAFPYVLLSSFPKLVEKLPRPGAWMESFKQAMSFLLFATAGFLLWVYMGQIDTGPMFKVMLGLTAIATAGWIYGRWCVLSKPKRTRLIGLGATALFATMGVLASKPPAKGLPWEEWSQEKVDAALEEGRPVYVDFTASWCVTCQVNKGTAYGRKVKELIKGHDILLLKADKSSRSPVIDAKIQELGRGAIPVNVLYVPGDDTPHITKEVLTEGYLADFMKEFLGEPDSEDTKSAANE
jgi:thiol:disulfide interchange protein DsbD